MFDSLECQRILKNEPVYRIKQVKEAVFQYLIDDWQKVTNLPRALREQLTSNCPLEIKAKLWETKDSQLAKSLITLDDGLKIETVLVFMGMGEPFLNTDNVFKAIKLLNDKDGFNLGARHFSISTVGITEGIKRLADNELRSQLMPINKRYPLNQVMKAIDIYIKKTNRRVMLEYIMIAGVNDSCQDAKKLAVLAKRPLCFVNLITFNPTGDFQPSPTKKINEFKQVLEKHQIPYTQRYKFGQEIKAACGQLAGK